MHLRLGQAGERKERSEMNPRTNKLEDIDEKLIRQLHMVGFGDALVERVISHFGEEQTKKILHSDPYRFMDLDGIAFRRADDIAQLCGITDKNDPRRQRAFIKFALQNNTTFGHVFLPMDKLQKELKKQKVTGNVLSLLSELEEEGSIVVEEQKIYLKKYWTAEVGVANAIKERNPSIPSKITETVNVSHIAQHYPELENDGDQMAAVSRFRVAHDSIITGGPGTGKSFITKTICDIIEDNDERYALTAPTGKAAKRLQEVTGHKAYTIHRLLGANQITYEWRYNAENQLTSYDWIIIDEASMIDIELAWRLLQAIPISTKIIFIGDIDQLAPVGPGSFFRDIIKSDKIPVFRFKTNHRQGKGSLIAENALRINRGELRLSFGPDLYFEEAPNPVIVREKITSLVKELAEEYPDVLRDIQVLSPQKATIIGTEAINQMLRFELNPMAKAGEPLSVGDKVMQIVNNYYLDVFNGFVGKVLAITPQGYTIEFFDHKTIEYPKKFEKQLMLAYCATVHKFQGSECKSGIVIISTTHTYMLTRNLLYTGMTRFKEKCVFLCDKMALRRAITNNKEKTRYSKLLERLG